MCLFLVLLGFLLVPVVVRYVVAPVIEEVRDSVAPREGRTESGRRSSRPPERHVELREAWSRMRHTNQDHRRAIAQETLRTAFDQPTEELHALAVRLAADEDRLPDNSRKLDLFHDAFRNYSRWNRQDPERWYDRLTERLVAWREAYPDSPHPSIALAGLYVDQAWHARGGGFADSVTDQGWRKFGEHLQKAVEVLEAAPESVLDEPVYYGLVMDIGLAQGFEREDMEDFFWSSRTVAPDHYEVYRAMSFYLAPRWYGTTEWEWHDWILDVLEEEELDPDEADRIYAMILMRAHWRHPGEELFQLPRVDWDRGRRGALLNLEQRPDSTPLPGNILKLAAAAGDWELAAEMVAFMNGTYDGAPWREEWDADFFDILLALEERGYQVRPADSGTSDEGLDQAGDAGDDELHSHAEEQEPHDAGQGIGTVDAEKIE